MALLVVNDHYLKIHFPSFLTGKLSDVAGLFVAAVWAAALLGSRVRSARALQGVLAGIAGIFTLLQLQSVLMGISAACNLLQLPRPNLVADPPTSPHWQCCPWLMASSGGRPHRKYSPHHLLPRGVSRPT